MPPKKSATALGRRARRTAHARLAERRRARVARQDPSQLRDHVGARAPGTAAARSTGATIPATSLAQGSSRRRQRRCTVTAAVREDGSWSVHGNTTGRPSRTARTSTARVASGTEHEADAPRPRRPTGQGEADAPRRRRPAGQGDRAGLQHRRAHADGRGYPCRRRGVPSGPALGRHPRRCRGAVHGVVDTALHGMARRGAARRLENAEGARLS